MRNSTVHLAIVVWLIVAATGMAGDARHVEAVTIFHGDFGEASDVDYDGWPDHWVRRTGPLYPHFVDIAIHDDATSASGKCLRLDLDGAAASVSSPPIRVMPRFSYVLEARLKCEQIRHSTVVVTLDFCDAKGRVLQTTRSRPLTTTKGWQTVPLGPVEPSHPAIERAVFGLHVERNAKGDLEGRVSLADVRLVRLPRIAVSTNNPSNVYTELDGVVIHCELSGIPERDPEIRFQLLDAADNELQSHAIRLTGRRINDESRRDRGASDSDDPSPDGYEATTEWRPSVPDYGYYRVAVRMLSSASSGAADDTRRELASRTIYVAVVPPLPMPRRGEFGWTLPEGDSPLSFQDLSRLLPQVGINWLKLPVWFDGSDPRRGDELIRFVEFMGASNIEVVGIIDRPPRGTDLAARLAPDAPVAELLSLDTAIWAPALEPVMTRLSLRVRWWQIGRDYDISFVGFPALNERFQELRRTLFRFGQDVRMGLCWDAAAEGGSSGRVAWEFQQLCLESPSSDEAFEAMLARPRQNDALRWVLIEPPPRSDHPAHTHEETLLARSTEFVRRLILAKVYGADAIIVPNPFDDENGLIRASGMPGELLLPWRTTAVMLGGAEYLGEMQLPSGSENRIFLRPDGQVVMVAWNDEPVKEVLYLGQDVRQFDLLGRSTSPAQEGREQVIPIGHTPTFILGLNETITRWRMAVKLEKLQVPSVFSKPHHNSLHFHNFFPQGVGGSVRIVVPQERQAEELAGGEDGGPELFGFTPDRWTIEPPQGTFQVAAGRDGQFPFEVRLKNALFGRQPLRLDFKIEADEQYEFSVYREMEVGTEDLTLQVNTHVDKDGTLIVEQLMTNRAAHLADFKCYLYAKGRGRRQRMHVYRLGPAVDRKLYRFPDGDDLLGKEMLLEIEELNGPRMIKHRFVATAGLEENDAADETDSNDSPRSSPGNTVDEDSNLASIGS